MKALYAASLAFLQRKTRRRSGGPIRDKYARSMISLPIPWAIEHECRSIRNSSLLRSVY